MEIDGTQRDVTSQDRRQPRRRLPAHQRRHGQPRHHPQDPQRGDRPGRPPHPFALQHRSRTPAPLVDGRTTSSMEGFRRPVYPAVQACRRCGRSVAPDASRRDGVAFVRIDAIRLYGGYAAALYCRGTFDGVYLRQRTFLFPPWLPASQPGLNSGLFSFPGRNQRSGYGFVTTSGFCAAGWCSPPGTPTPGPVGKPYAPSPRTLALSTSARPLSTAGRGPPM